MHCETDWINSQKWKYSQQIKCDHTYAENRQHSFDLLENMKHDDENKQKKRTLYCTYNIISFDCNIPNTIFWVFTRCLQYFFLAISLCLAFFFSCREYNSVLKNWFMCSIHCKIVCLNAYVTSKEIKTEKKTRAMDK